MSFRGGSSAAATSKMECFVIIVNGWKPLTIITKHSILDDAAALDPSLSLSVWLSWMDLFNACLIIEVEIDFGKPFQEATYFISLISSYIIVNISEYKLF